MFSNINIVFSESVYTKSWLLWCGLFFWFGLWLWYHSASGEVCQMVIVYKSGKRAPIMLYHRPFEMSLSTLYDIQDQGKTEYPTQVVIWNVEQLVQFLYKNFVLHRSVLGVVFYM